MAEKKQKQKQKEAGPQKLPVIMVAVVAAGVILAFGFGVVLGNMVSGGGGGGPMVLQDGTPLGTRLSTMENAISGDQLSESEMKELLGQMEKNTAQAIVGEVKKVIEGKVIDLMDPPVKALKIEAGNDLPVMGPEDAAITVVECSDFECPYCARMAAMLEAIMERTDDKVKLVFYDRPLVAVRQDGFPFHPYSMLAHEASAEAHVQGNFWEMYMEIFKNQQQVFPQRPKNQEEYRKRQAECIDNLVELAEGIGLDGGKMRSALENGTHRPLIEKRVEKMDQLEVHSTPTIYMNNYAKISDPNTILKMAGEATVLE